MPQANGELSLREEVDIDVQEPTGCARTRWRAELRVLVSLAVPVMTTMATQQGMVVTDQIMVGHLGSNELAAASLGNTWFNFWLYFMMGMATALDTLGSQAHGAGDMKAYWTAATSSAVVLSLALLPMAVGLWFSGYVVQALFHQPADLAEMSGSFCKLLIPGLWPMIWGLVATKLLQTRGVTTPSAVIGILTFLANIGLNFFFIGRYGFYGAPVATTVSRILQAILSFAWLGIELHVKGKGCNSKWVELLRGGLNWRAVSTFIVLGLPGGLMLLMEAASFEITTALAGRLGTMAVDTHTILLSLLGFAFMSGPFGLSIAGSIRVGMLLGGGDATTARISSWLTIIASAVYMAIAITFLGLTKNRVGRWFVGDNENIVAAVASLIPIMLTVQMFDGISGATAGVLRGMGKQRMLLIFNVLGFWLGGMVPGYIMTFHFGLGVKGLWLGIASGITITAALCAGCLFFADVEEEARRAQATVELLSGGTEEGTRLPDVESPSCQEMSNGENDVHQKRADYGSKQNATDLQLVELSPRRIKDEEDRRLVEPEEDGDCSDEPDECQSLIRSARK